MREPNLAVRTSLGELAEEPVDQTGPTGDFVYVDISKDPDAKEIVRVINNGNASVPTLVFPDKSTLTEPSRAELQAKLQEYGFEDPGGTILDAWRENWIFTFLGFVFLVFAGAAQNWILAAIGLAFLAYPPISYKFRL